ncbi:MAG: ATP-dependent DNA ligase [Micromonosporaceae bacterium]|nr:ATP-dependent DNA ligase [Micromonosporaceae bacterium]
MADRLETYRKKRDAARTPEPVPKRKRRSAKGDGDIFVIQQHHARRLHWDFRLERDGVLVSWAIPKGIPRDPERNHLAVHTEDHPMEYAGFTGEIPEGEYGAGTVKLHDRGTYVTEKWRDNEVMVTLDGKRTSGRYVLFRTRGDDWMIHRMDPPDAGWEPMPELLQPMRATRGSLPDEAERWAYEMRWDGLRAIAYVSGGRLVLRDDADADVTGRYPELRELAEALAPVEGVLDGEIVAFRGGSLSADALAARSEESDPVRARRRAGRNPVTYLVYDLLYVDGESLLGLDYAERRGRLDDLDIAGDRWQVPPSFPEDGEAAMAASQEQGLSGVVAKCLDSPYRPGKRTRDWLDVRHKKQRRA